MSEISFFIPIRFAPRPSSLYRIVEWAEDVISFGKKWAILSPKEATRFEDRGDVPMWKTACKVVLYATVVLPLLALIIKGVFRMTIKGSPPPPPPAILGLHNPGANCWLNALFQVVHALPWLQPRTEDKNPYLQRWLQELTQHNQSIHDQDTTSRADTQEIRTQLQSILQWGVDRNGTREDPSDALMPLLEDKNIEMTTLLIEKASDAPQINSGDKQKNLLVMRLERGGTQGKILQPIQIPMAVGDDLKLQAFIVHCGESSVRGHYVAYVQKDAQWWQANDSRCKEAEQAELNQLLNPETQNPNTPYLLFYAKAPLTDSPGPRLLGGAS